MGNSAHPHSSAWLERINSETKALARHMFEVYGRHGEQLDVSDLPHLRRVATAPNLKQKSELSNGPPKPLPTPVSGAAPRFLGPYDPSLVNVSGFGATTHLHLRVGGAADHHVTPWDRSTPSRQGSAACSGADRCSSSLTSYTGTRSSPPKTAATSWTGSKKSRGSALSAASSVLLKKEIEDAVQREVGKLLQQEVLTAPDDVGPD